MNDEFNNVPLEKDLKAFKEAIQTVANRIGYFVSILRSDLAWGTRTLGCDNSGTFRNEGNGLKQKCTKKSECPFRLKCLKIADEWISNSSILENGHDRLVKDLIAHPYVRRLNQNELNKISLLKASSICSSE